MKTLIIGDTMTAAIKKLIKLYQYYKKYEIKIINFQIIKNTIIVNFNNNEEITIMSFDYFKNQNKKFQYNNIYFDRNINQAKFFNIVFPYLQTSSTMWQF